MVNEIALVLLFGPFGWKVAALYLATGLLIAMSAGWIIGRLKLEKHVEDWVATKTGGVGGNCAANTADAPQDFAARITAGREAVRDIVGRVWLYVIFGIAVGAGIHGFVPTNAMAAIMGKEAWWSVPLSVLIGVPMYANAASIIPVVQALLGKGAALKTCGAGRAPEGRCGALHAARLIAPQHADAIEARYAATLGGTHCRELREADLHPCADCVTTACALVTAARAGELT